MNPFSFHTISSSSHLRFIGSPWHRKGFREYNIPKDYFYSSGCKITTSPWIFAKTVFNTTNLLYLTWTTQVIPRKTTHFSYLAWKGFRADRKYATAFPLSLLEISGNKSAHFVFVLYKYKSDPNKPEYESAECPLSTVTRKSAERLLERVCSLFLLSENQPWNFIKTFSSVTFLKAVYMIEKAKHSDKNKYECKYYFLENNVWRSCLLIKRINCPFFLFPGQIVFLFRLWDLDKGKTEGLKQIKHIHIEKNRKTYPSLNWEALIQS